MDGIRKLIKLKDWYRQTHSIVRMQNLLTYASSDEATRARLFTERLIMQPQHQSFLFIWNCFQICLRSVSYFCHFIGLSIIVCVTSSLRRPRCAAPRLVGFLHELWSLTCRCILHIGSTYKIQMQPRDKVMLSKKGLGCLVCARQEIDSSLIFKFISELSTLNGLYSSWLWGNRVNLLNKT